MNIKKTTEYRDDDKAMFYSYDIGTSGQSASLLEATL